MKHLKKAVKLASSSAAGGLRMSVIGLTNSLSTLAGKSAALGAGGKIIANYSGLMTGEKVKDLEGSKTEIVLLCGGYERGEYFDGMEKYADAGSFEAYKCPSFILAILLSAKMSERP